MTNLTHGQILETAMKSKGISPALLASLLNVEKRTIYNWIKSKTLKAEILIGVGLAINHDFSEQIPSLASVKSATSTVNIEVGKQIGNADSWKAKYLELLEKYLQLVSIVKNKTN